MPAALLAAVAAVSLPCAARADRMDKQLHEKMPAVKKKLQSKGYKNVGVLRFRVQVGKKAASFDNAPYNGNLPRRIENLLIINGGPSEDGALGVIRDAGKAAAAAGAGDWFGDESQCRKLFDVSYPLAWGDKKVKADAFLTGLVFLAPDMKKTTVTLFCFDKENLEPEELVRFTLATDRDVVRDLGLSFVVNARTREALAKKRTADDVDRAVMDSLEKEMQATDLAGLEATVLVDGKTSPLKAAGTDEDGPRWLLPCPPADTPVALRLRNTTDKTLGVVIKLNGFSTFRGLTPPPEWCQKWLVRPGKTVTIKGFYEPGEGSDERLSVRPFKVLTGEAAKTARAQLGDRAGLLEIDVFATGGEDDEVLEISARGLPASKEREKEKDAKAQSYKSVRASLLKEAKLRTETNVRTTDKRDELLVPDTEAIKAEKFKTKDFEGHLVAHLAAKIMPKD
jgi:hypothetical protein